MKKPIFVLICALLLISCGDPHSAPQPRSGLIEGCYNCIGWTGSNEYSKWGTTLWRKWFSTDEFLPPCDITSCENSGVALDCMTIFKYSIRVATNTQENCYTFP